MDDQVCNVLSEIDDLFTKGAVNVVRFNKFTKCHSYCPYENNSKKNKCTNDYERINALGSYLFKEIMDIDKAFNWPDDAKRHIEVFMIWLGDKLFRINNDYKATLEESYKINLEKYVGNVNYWETISKKLYKDATIKKMSEFYNLLSQICKLITEYNKNPKKPDSRSLGNHSTRCINFYRAIISSANECGPYLKLLDSLKMIYEIFRMQKIDNNYNISNKDKTLLLNRIQHLTRFKGVNQYLLSVTAKPSFDDKECIEAKSKDEQLGEKKVSTNLQGKRKDNVLPKKSDKGPQTKSSPSTSQGKKPPTAPRPRPQPQPQPQPQPKPQSVAPTSPASPIPVPPQQSTDTKQANPKQTGPLPAVPPSQDGGSLQTPKTGEIHQNGQGGTADRKGETSSGSGVTQDSQGRSSGGSGDGQGSGVHGSGVAGGGPGGGKGDAGSGGNGGGSAQGDQGKSPDGTGSVQGGQAKGPGGPPGGNPVPASSGTGTTPSPDTPVPPGSQPGSQPGPQSQPEQQSADSLPTDPSSPQDDPSLQKHQTGAPISGSSTSGEIFNFESSFREFLLKGMDKLNKVPEFIKDNQQRLNDAKDQISNAYNGAMENLKKVYDKSNNYLNNFISNVTSHLNNIDAPSKPDGSQSGPGKSMDGGNPPSKLPSNSQPNVPPIMPPGPSPNPLPTPPQHPQLPPSPNSTHPKQSSSPTQPIIHNPTSINPSNHKTMVQLINSLSSNLNLKKPWNILPTTWNGSGNCKPEIYFMNATLVCCTSEQCSLTGISVTLILIPIILLIAYKYLSFGSSKKSEKKNMKRVINFHDGNRKTKIIISSNDRNKDLKPVINSVGRKKDSLLNIYKLMQADPIPFINLFFLLIFFVYKRKDNFLEL
ncbi:PIR protein CIR protein [Plasmodium vinckei]|uniref:PIR protein CIR protein n=1 Tax=Plasmodium vinckei TaxID=5860 RepID=A0A6V7T0X8_PLAVN|nr:PIR protein CIR protein [Plasmodium vinckei]